jgi:hypothetical protein
MNIYIYIYVCMSIYIYIYISGPGRVGGEAFSRALSLDEVSNVHLTKSAMFT